ncbi:MAG: SpoIVB peptidase, partial [Ruminococcus sp.]|nr:SpoIVB peptidase [Ruminococcus sp.]
TYYDDDKKIFSALGHGICDNDTSALLPLGEARVVKSSVSGVTKSAVGKIGSLNGYFTDKEFGSLTKNTDSGVFGTITDNFYQKFPRLEIASADDFSTGKAEIYSTIGGGEPQSFEVEITGLCNKNVESNENFVIMVTDERLLSDCGGIVQGMSGSPIVKDGKLLGAVTHVFLNHPNEGYGVFAQNMALVYEN